MGEQIGLTAEGGFELGAYCAKPKGPAAGGIVVLQEIFGVNVHIRDLCDRYAALGYYAVAPQLYDRFERDFQSGYSSEEIATGRALKARANDAIDDVMRDVDAARAEAARAGNVGAVGFCWGGVITYLAACRLRISAASAYYGGGIVPFLDETPQCPAMFHFGRKDTGIPLTDVEQIATVHPQCPVHLYDADHGFNCDRRAQFDPAAAAIANVRTFRLFDKHLGG